MKVEKKKETKKRREERGEERREVKKIGFGEERNIKKGREGKGRKQKELKQQTKYLVKRKEIGTLCKQTEGNVDRPSTAHHGICWVEVPVHVAHDIVGSGCSQFRGVCWGRKKGGREMGGERRK